MRTAAGEETPEKYYLGHNVSYEKIVEEFPKFVRDDGLISAFSGRIYPDAGSGTRVSDAGTRLLDFLLITKNHVVLWGRGLYGQTMNAIPYTEISGVTFTKCIIFGEIVITTGTGQKRFGDIYHEDVNVASTMIQKMIRTVRQNQPYHVPEEGPATEYLVLRKYHSSSQISSFNLTPAT